MTESSHAQDPQAEEPAQPITAGQAPLEDAPAKIHPPLEPSALRAVGIEDVVSGQYDAAIDEDQDEIVDYLRAKGAKESDKHH